MKFFLYTRSQQKVLFDSPVTSLSIDRLLKRIAESSKDRKPIPIQKIVAEASEHEIEVLFLEALMEYNNVFKEAAPDRTVDDVKAEAKKACLETFLRSSRSKKGNPQAYSRYLNQVFENFRQKDELFKGSPSKGGKFQ